MSHIKLSPTDEAEVHEQIYSLLSTGQLNYVLTHQWKPNWITLKSGTQVNIGFPEIFLYENLPLLIEFVNTLNPAKLAIILEDEEVSVWIDEENKPPKWFGKKAYDVWDFLSTFMEVTDYDIPKSLTSEGYILQSQINELLKLYEINTSTIEGSSDEEMYYINLLNEIRKGPPQVRGNI